MHFRSTYLNKNVVENDVTYKILKNSKKKYPKIRILTRSSESRKCG